MSLVDNPIYKGIASIGDAIDTTLFGSGDSNPVWLPYQTITNPDGSTAMVYKNRLTGETQTFQTTDGVNLGSQYIGDTSSLLDYQSGTPGIFTSITRNWQMLALIGVLFAVVVFKRSR